MSKMFLISAFCLGCGAKSPTANHAPAVSNACGVVTYSCVTSDGCIEGGDDFKAQFDMHCQGMGGKASALPCDQANALGSCQSTKLMRDTTACGVWWMPAGARDLASSQATCEKHGTFTAITP